jgi:hypothetical protein
MSHQIKNLQKALLYQADCALATYEHLLVMKKHSKHEVKRQHSIALKAVFATGLTKEEIKEMDPGNRIHDHWECVYEK